jgi:hypothetical protein
MCYIRVSHDKAVLNTDIEIGVDLGVCGDDCDCTQLNVVQIFVGLIMYRLSGDV